MADCDHPRDQLRPFAPSTEWLQRYECFACGAFIEERPRLEWIGFEYVVTQEGDE